MSLDKYFPETIFTKKWVEEFGLEKAVIKQLTVIVGELFEAQDDFSRENNDRVLMELVDVMQATYTAIRMIPGYSDEKINKIVNEVKAKNEKRGYYVQ